MIRFLACGFMAVALLASGCCGPMACGPQGCNDCDGAGMYGGGQGMMMSPLDSLRNARKQLVCGGGGCGETYLGEWRSTPPDACDPCHNDQFVGGATPCQPFCWQPGTLINMFGGVYGKRFCNDCGATGGGCGCGGEMIEGHHHAGGAAGCTTCSTGNQINAGRIARQPAANAPRVSNAAGMMRGSAVNTNQRTIRR